MPMPHENLWSAVEHKLSGAEFFLKQMGRDIVPPSLNSPHLAAIASTGVIVSHPWQERFYYHLDAFLAMARSVPEIIQCCFGVDRLMRRWLARLTTSEVTRRRTFQKQFEPLSQTFAAKPLTRARNVTLHRTGVPPTEVHVVGRWDSYSGGPLAAIPQSEILPIVAGNDPALQWAATEPAQPVQPTANDFWLLMPPGSSTSKVQLFPECQAFLDAARTLISDAKKIAAAIHGSDPLTAPPL
jgi:hypothetical protein